MSKEQLIASYPDAMFSGIQGLLLILLICLAVMAVFAGLGALMDFSSKGIMLGVTVGLLGALVTLSFLMGNYDEPSKESVLAWESKYSEYLETQPLEKYDVKRLNISPRRYQGGHIGEYLVELSTDNKIKDTLTSNFVRDVEAEDSWYIEARYTYFEDERLYAYNGYQDVILHLSKQISEGDK